MRIKMFHWCTAIFFSIAIHPPCLGAPEGLDWVIYAGSTGTGVPAPALERLRRIERLLASEFAASVAATRSGVVGLEGERLVCVTLVEGARGAALLRRLRSEVDGIRLLSLSPKHCPLAPAPK